MAEKRQSILVVEDDPNLRRMYRTVLMLDGFRAEVAADGLAALRKLEDDRPDLIVLDLHLPLIDGLTVMSELRARNDTRSIPVVVVTGSDYQYAVAQASAILRKPCAPDELIETVERHLARAA